MFKVRLKTLLAALGAAFLGALTIYANLGLLGASAWLISTAALRPPLAELSLAIVGVRFFGLLRAFSRYIERLVSHDVTLSLLANSRVRLYTALERSLSVDRQSIERGDLFSRLIADVETLKYFYLRVAFPLMTALLVIAGAAGIIGWLAPPLFWPLVGLFALTGIGLPIFIRCRGKVKGAAVMEARAKLSGSLADSVEGLTELASFNSSMSQAARVVKFNALYSESKQQVNRLTVMAETVSLLCANLTVIALLVLAVPLVAGGQLEGVYLAVILLMAQASFEALLPLPAAVYYVQESSAAIGRIRELLSLKPEGLTGSQSIKGARPHLQAVNLAFTYASELPRTFSNLSFNLPWGKRLAIVGASGSGKSTVAGILTRFLDYDEGSLTLNGHELKSFKPEEVRRMFSVVSQDTYLFNASIRDNILLAKPSATEAELQAAIQGAMLDDYINRLPEGLETGTGMNGMALSGGERQRLALARALLKDAPIWLLDEPTAGLDSQTEAAVFDNILKAAGNRTIILITHRLRMLETMDEIILLADGQVVEHGSFQELLESKGQFFQRWGLERDMLNIS